ncbi:MAG TPA: outer membrane protein assembly factor BamE [Burkholderiales bacterium]|nr:outer membrane protein assembly factor BamE [Burkholderiales bacterium]
MHTVFYRGGARILPLAIAALLPSCKSVQVPSVPGLTPYRITIQQGNFISQEMVSQLKPGMTKEQVRFVLGTPLVNDIFNADRWDYVFFKEYPNGKREQRNLSVVFQDNRLARVLGDLLPAEGAAAPQATGFEPIVKPDASAKPADAAPASVAKPAAEAAKPATEAPKPAADAAKPEVPVQNWSAAGDAPEPKPAEAPAPAPNTEEKKAADGDSEKGFFGRWLEKIGL